MLQGWWWRVTLQVCVCVCDVTGVGGCDVTGCVCVCDVTCVGGGCFRGVCVILQGWVGVMLQGVCDVTGVDGCDVTG